jgi:hypothetical protein
MNAGIALSYFVMIRDRLRQFGTPLRRVSALGTNNLGRLASNGAGETDSFGQMTGSALRHYIPSLYPLFVQCNEAETRGERRCLRKRKKSQPARLRTSAEFFDPNAMQLHTACSIRLVLPALGT